MSDEPTRAADLALVQKHIDALGEHFDSVQIFVTRHAEGELGGTVSINLGSGNYFSRYGHVHAWCIRQDEQERMDRRNSDNP